MLANFAAAGILCAISNQPAGEGAQPFLRGLQATRIVLALLAIVIFGRIGYLQITRRIAWWRLPLWFFSRTAFAATNIIPGW
jgi:hypothetical protein